MTRTVQNKNRIFTVLKALEAYGMNEWITDVDLATLSGFPASDVRDTMNTASTSLKYEGVLERTGHAGAWSYRLVGPIDWETVGSRAGTKNGYASKQIAVPLLKWAAQRGSRSAFTRQQVMSALRIDADPARNALTRLVNKGDLVVVSNDSWRLADHIELVAKPKVEAPIASDMRPMPNPYQAPLISTSPQGMKEEAVSLSAALKAAAAVPTKKTMEQCIDDALMAIVDDVVFTPGQMKRVLPMALAFQRQCEALYLAIREA